MRIWIVRKGFDFEPDVESWYFLNKLNALVKKREIEGDEDNIFGVEFFSVDTED